ncbi:MlaC/ttg2D family ABC transporter substrate-binding protein [Paraburkholderia sp. GAS334]|uniref:MlaC/ttg2D family ABC transporter substrate-binding protein n=1 Tax=Paraburkholderia sp. GAS334 TaxID=3035131 RepID=UPI003D1BD36C
MLNNLLRFSFIAMLVSFCGLAAGQAEDVNSPDGMIRMVTQQVLTEIKSDKEIQAGNLTRITELVNQKILPYIDFNRTTRLVMGRYWASATPQQQQQITEQFKLLLIHTYSGALAQVRDQQMTYQPFRSSPTDTDVIVRSSVVNNDKTIELDYRLYKTPNGWRVYDLNILGVWLIQVYKQQFADQIAQHGVDGLLDFLTQRNQQITTGG